MKGNEFSYALEFYNNKIFNFDDVKLYKNKVKEAQKIERFFLGIIPDVDVIRKYILRSYKFNKKITFKNRINYIKGLILADEIVNLDDLDEFFYNVENKICLAESESLWKYKGNIVSLDNDDFLEGKFDGSSTMIVELYSDDVNTYFENYSNEENDYDDYNDEYDEEASEEQDKKNIIVDNYAEIIEFDELDDRFIPLNLKEKVDIFNKNKRIIVSEIIKRKNINSNDSIYVKRGMYAWLNYILNNMEAYYNISVKTLEYKNKNASDYI